VIGGAQEATGTPRVETQEAGAPDEAADQPVSAVDATRFAHASEAEMARILDFYQVRWDYEPTTFPILWNLEGEVVESFAPDFYLPDLEVFLEMTTLKQRLVRKKNRKLRRLRELYPDIRIKLFYARDFRAMMLKYGRLGLAASLSGTTGQVVRTPLGPAEAPEVEPVEIVLATIEPSLIEALIPVAEVVVDADVVAIDGPSADGLSASPGPRAKPRTRSARRRRRAARPTEAGAEREAGA
jgi:hypothetical protein